MTVKYEVELAPTIGTPFLFHWYENDGEFVQAPGLPVNVFPGILVPEIVGKLVLTGMVASISKAPKSNAVPACCLP